MTWYEHWFNHPLYLDLYSHRDEEEARQAVDLVLSAAQLRPGSRILDLGCGNGRHAISMAQRGLIVAGMDLSPLLLDIAHTSARKTDVDISLARGDMRSLPFRKVFDAVVQLFTAFGYFDDDSENVAVIRQVAGIVKPGGTYVLDFLNEPYVTATLAPRTETRMEGTIVVQERSIQNGRVDKTITVKKRGEVEARFSESVRMYSPADLTAMFEATGFTVSEVFGDYRGNPLTENSPRCILVGTRNKDA